MTSKRGNVVVGTGWRRSRSATPRSSRSPIRYHAGPDAEPDRVYLIAVFVIPIVTVSVFVTVTVTMTVAMMFVRMAICAIAIVVVMPMLV